MFSVYMIYTTMMITSLKYIDVLCHGNFSPFLYLYDVVMLTIIT